MSGPGRLSALRTADITIHCIKSIGVLGCERHFFSDVEILDFDLSAADIASGIGARMARAGNRVNAFDILITGIALAHHAGAIVTADTDFHEIAKYAGIEIRNYDRANVNR